MFEIKGLEKLMRQLDELQRAMADLDGDIATVKFNPHDQRDVERAIREMERAIDAKVAPYQHNPTVRNIATAAKQNFRERLLKRAADARHSLTLRFIIAIQNPIGRAADEVRVDPAFQSHRVDVFLNRDKFGIHALDLGRNQ